MATHSTPMSSLEADVLVIGGGSTGVGVARKKVKDNKEK